jgi:hypothetical protein
MSPPKLPEPFRSIADLARGAPPEFTADALLRMVESGKLADQDARRALMEEAFQLAAAAKFPCECKGLPGTTTDTASGSLSQAYALKLDVLSLQSRAVRDMLPLDPAKARELFGQIARPNARAAHLRRRAGLRSLGLLSSLERGGQRRVHAKGAGQRGAPQFLDYLGQATSPSGSAPLARRDPKRGRHRTATARPVGRFNGLLENMQPDNRSFAASLPALSDSSRPARLARKIPAEEPRLRDRRSAVPQSKPAKKPSTPKLDSYWQSANAQQLLQAGTKLRYSPSTQLLTKPIAPRPNGSSSWPII